jgi:hypothetical protein
MTLQFFYLELGWNEGKQKQGGCVGMMFDRGGGAG